MLTKLLILAASLCMSGCETSPTGAGPLANRSDEPPPTPAAPVEQPHPQKADPAAAPAHANPPQIPPEIDQLLDRLEKSSPDLNSFIADIIYEKEDAVLARSDRRMGQLIYRRDAKTGEKSFAAIFDALIVGDIKRAESKRYIFNGRWLAEIDDKEKQFIKREIVPPGKQLDPLKLGEGPFPLPIGQPKSEVLARFDVAATAVPNAGLLKTLQNVDGLLLTPKPNTPEAKEFSRVEIFYDRETLLPVGVNAIESNGDRKTIKLTNAKRNPALDQSKLAKLNINEPDPREWRIDVRPWNNNQPK